MGMFSRLFNAGTEPAPAAEAPVAPPPEGGDYDQAVLVYIPSPSAETPVEVPGLEARLSELIGRDKLGIFEGVRPNPNGATVRMYGPDAKRLFAGIEELLRGEAACEGARVVIRTGGPGAPEREVRL